MGIFSVSKEVYRFIFVVLAVLLILNIYAPAHPPLLLKITSTVLIILSIIPMVIFLLQKEYAPFFGMLCGIFSLYYGLPIFILKEYKPAPYFSISYSHELVLKASVFALIGLCFLIVGYYFIPSKIIPKIRMVWNVEKAKLSGFMVSVIGIIFYIIKIQFPFFIVLGQILYLFSSLILIGIGVLYILQLLNKLSLKEKLFLWGGIIPFKLILGVITGGIKNGLEVIIFLLYIYISIKRRIPYLAIASFFIVFVLLNYVKDEYRRKVWRGEEKYSILNKCEIFKDIGIKFFREINPEMMDQAVQKFTSRVSFIMIFTHVLGKTPQEVPFLKGASYHPFLVKMIPRFIYPQKHKENFGQIFGHRYKLIGEDDEVTSVNPGQLVEMYVNFGLLGIVLGMFILGVIYKMLVAFLQSSVSGEGGVLVGSFIFFNLFNIESNLSMVLGGIFYSLIFAVIINLFFTKESRIVLK